MSAGLKRGAHPVPALPDGGRRETRDGEGGQAARDMNLDKGLIGFHAHLAPAEQLDQTHGQRPGTAPGGP